MIIRSVKHQHYFNQNDRNKAKIIVIEMIRKFSPIVSKWHRNFGQSEIILSMDNGHSKNMEEEKLKKEK